MQTVSEEPSKAVMPQSPLEAMGSVTAVLDRWPMAIQLVSLSLVSMLKRIWFTIFGISA